MNSHAIHTFTSKLCTGTKDGSLAHGLLHTKGEALQIVLTDTVVHKLSVFVSLITELILRDQIKLLKHKAYIKNITSNMCLSWG